MLVAPELRPLGGQFLGGPGQDDATHPAVFTLKPGHGAQEPDLDALVPRLGKLVGTGEREALVDPVDAHRAQAEPPGRPGHVQRGVPRA